MDSEVFEGRDRLLSKSPRKGPNVFTVSFETLNKVIEFEYSVKCIVPLVLYVSTLDERIRMLRHRWKFGHRSR